MTLKGRIVFALLFPVLFAQAQISGRITNTNGEPLAFASVYLKGTSRGTTSNIEGEYVLQIDPGEYELVFQYIGYRSKTERIRVGSRPVELDVVLQEEAIELTEVVVSAGAEDPAYAVIRKAMEKRRYYLEQIDAYQCDVYVKGNIKILDAPEKILGIEVGDLGGTLDSNRQGIIYLSESKSRLSFQQPDKVKEEMLFSKVSGNDNGFSFNQASEMDFNLYENYSNFGRQIVSPIAGNALQFYRYRLLGTLYSDDGRLINKIEILPKRSEDPVYRGVIYIVEDLWNIQSADLLLLQGAMKQPGLDSLYIRQVYVPVREPDAWKIFSQTIHFNAGVLSIRLEGTFTGIYSDYDLNPQWEKDFFGPEVFLVQDGANKQGLAFWDSIRPIPLTREEAVDYVRKDSLQEVWRSKPYLDSIDARNNRFTPLNLLAGYTYSRSYDRKFYTFSSPLSTIEFNTVQGWNGDFRFSYRKQFDEDGFRWLEIKPAVNYGFSDKRLRGSLGVTYRFNQIYRTEWSLSGGIEAVQFNTADPISPSLNSLMSLWAEENYLKLYDKSFAQTGIQTEIVNGVFLTTQVEYARRSPLRNRSDYTFRKKDGEKKYTSNNPLNPEADSPLFSTHHALISQVSLRLRYKQKYFSYPNQKLVAGSPLPDLWIDYRRGWAIAGAEARFDHLAVRLEEDRIGAGVLGHSEFMLEGGWFLNRKPNFFMDFRHFNGNQTPFGNPNRYLSSFMKLPYYQYSTGSSYFQGHFQHFFDGFLLDKLPGIRKLGWTSVAGVSFLYTEEQEAYLELSFGLDNIGFGIFRLFRLDVVGARRPGGKWNAGLLIGMRFP